MEMAIRVGACDGAGINNAEFVENGGIQLRVQCAGGAAFDGQGMAGGLGNGRCLGGWCTVHWCRGGSWQFKRNLRFELSRYCGRFAKENFLNENGNGRHAVSPPVFV